MPEKLGQCAYRVIGYDGSFRAYIGEKKSVCRFCGKRVPEVKFRKKAHALSESIGNKYIINNEECDSCNDRFSKIEEDFYRRHAAILSIYNIKGKNGSRKIKTETIDIFDQNGIVTIDPHKKESVSIRYDSNGIGTMDFSLELKYHPHIPQNVYKCLVKYALSIVESQYIIKLNKAVAWINNDSFSIKQLPNVIYYYTKFHSHPRAAVFIRNEENTKFPFAFSLVEFANIGYCFMIPFGNDEPITGYMQHSLIGAYLQLSNGAPYCLIDLSNTKKVINRTNFSIGNLDKSTAISLPYPVTTEAIDELKNKGLI